MYLTFTEPGTFLGLKNSRLLVKRDKSLIKEVPLNKVKFIVVESKGIAFSSDLAIDCSLRGIQLFLLNFKGEAVTALYGQHHHATAKIRQKQFEFIKNGKSAELSAHVISAKIKNQRSLLLYMGKYIHHKKMEKETALITETCDKMLLTAKEIDRNPSSFERDVLLGHEGVSARLYWKTLRECSLLADSFIKREGRGSKEPVNAMLNYGYAILASHIWRALQNAGLELYSGFLHEQRPGKPSLVLDIMEVYRAWVVDHVVIKHSAQYSSFDYKCKKAVINDIHSIMQRRYRFKGKKVKLEAIIQRQMYRLAGHFAGNKSYKPYLFRW